MKALEIYSERFQPTGSIAGNGAKNQLGRPALGPLALLVRESVQNCWDARLGAGAPVEVHFDLRTLDGPSIELLRDSVLPAKSWPSSLPVTYPRALAEGRFAVMEISDRNTTGMGGPTRGDQLVEAGERSDFANFLRNLGLPRDVALGGGTYGFGKMSYYLFSGASTLCVHTRCMHHGRIESRLMLAAIGGQYSVRGTLNPGNYTGRHWWGRMAADGIVDPVVGAEADQIAAGLGMRGFAEPSATGTTIAILLPALETNDMDEAAKGIGDSLLWWFWPKWVPDEQGILPMKFAITVHGRDMAVPSPYASEPWRHFVTALEALNGSREPGVGEVSMSDVQSLRPSRHLGRLALLKFPAPGTHDADGSTEEDGEGGAERSPLDGCARHIAFMRDARLVVKYLAGPRLATDHVGYAGVFLASREPEVDEAFAQAEPPTHDDWVATNLPKGVGRTWVNVALRNIERRIKEYALPAPVSLSGNNNDAPLGAISSYMGGLIAALDGGGGGEGFVRTSVPPQTPRAHTRRPRVREIGDGNTVVINGRRAFAVTFDLGDAARSQVVRVTANARVVLDGGASVEKEPPKGAETVDLIGWFDCTGAVISGELGVDIGAMDKGPWQVVVSIPEATAVQVLLSAAAGGAE